MTNTKENKTLSNPFSTGGGGTTFEHLVGASYLVSLLSCDIPRGLDWGITESIQFQHRWSGCLLDDIVVVSNNNSQKRKLALQIKHNLQFTNTKSNKTFKRVIDDCWKTFNSDLGWSFNKNIDRIGIGLGIYNENIDKDLRPVLEWARTAKNEIEFLEKLSTLEFSSAKKKKYIKTIKELLLESKGSSLTDLELW